MGHIYTVMNKWITNKDLPTAQGLYPMLTSPKWEGNPKEGRDVYTYS